MGYLLPTDYCNFGLAADTTDDWVVAASRPDRRPLQATEPEYHTVR